MRFLSTIFATFCIALGAAQATQLQIGLSNESVAITSSFDGDSVVVFGSIEGGDPEALTLAQYDLVVALVGPDADIVVRRKQRRAGIWMNGASLPFIRVPSFYSMASNRKLIEIAEPPVLSKNRIGFEYLKFETGATLIADSEIQTFRESLNRLKASQELSLKRTDGVKFLSPTLFRAKLSVPANVPIGRHTARVWLFKNGEVIAREAARLEVRKIGFEQFMYNLAYKNGLLYGIIAVLVAIFTGWLASVVFRKD
ncbi:TIGR02186 family protein [Pseudahrensia aquimaris]|uniref:TIGR02186 family protein n=1 Tax=Pseudahrensia aquimaris TaxID=744461 RepID=A0ABW3FKG5_9HYPH